MIHHKDRTLCATSGTCANTDCPRWTDFGKSCDLPLSLAEFKGRFIALGLWSIRR